MTRVIHHSRAQQGELVIELLPPECVGEVHAVEPRPGDCAHHVRNEGAFKVQLAGYDEGQKGGRWAASKVQQAESNCAMPTSEGA